MEIKRLGDNKIRCALTETEIQELGFDIDEIIGNSETTQQFMRVVLSMVEEQEHIDMENIAPMVKAELLQDHSMAITFGGDAEMNFKSLVDTVSHLMNRIEAGKKLAEDASMTVEEASGAAAEETKGASEAAKKSQKANKKEPMICALRFSSMEHMMAMSRVCFPERQPKSSLYKMEDAYYLILDFNGFTKEEMRPFALGTVEYDDGHSSDVGQIAHIIEYGKCIIRNEALQMLMQL